MPHSAPICRLISGMKPLHSLQERLVWTSRPSTWLSLHSFTRLSRESSRLMALGTRQ